MNLIFRPRTALKIIAVYVTISAINIAALAAPPSRITLARNTGTTVIQGRLNGYSDMQHFVLHARKGQQISLVTTHGGAAVITLKYPSGQTNGAPGGVDAVLPETGDYGINISEHRTGEAWHGRYTLQITLH